MHHPKVLILMGSEHDLPVMEEAAKALAELRVEAEMAIASAHRTPAKVSSLVSNAAARGIKVIIAGAGMAAHLAGVVASQTSLPVIGVPLEGPALGGIDALLSTAQMPAGVPVACMAVGKAGARNAGIFAAEILALCDEALAKKLADLRTQMAEKVEEADAKLKP
jgi:5-(carboxyamino)imidazole ribonucleotide mutase